MAKATAGILARLGVPGAILASMRPSQWIKNLVVLTPIVFSRHLTEAGTVFRALAAAGLFCAVSGSVYILNDLFDAERDRRHPLKARRPIASGRLGTVPALASAVLILTAALMAGFLLAPPFGAVLVIYVVLNFAYSLWLKDVVILDVMLIASGFVLRAIGGGLAIDVAISQWLILCALLLSLFLALCKRRQELESLAAAHDHRAALREYSLTFLDQMINVVTPSTLVAYLLYTLSPEVEMKLNTRHLYLTVPFVLYGIFRYLYLVHRRGEGGNPAQAFLTDRPLLACVGLWALTVVIILYVARPVS